MCGTDSLGAPELQSLRKIKAPCPDQHSPWLLKMAATQSAPMLTDMFQTSIHESKLPKQFNEGKLMCAAFSRKGIRVMLKTIDRFL